MIGNYILANRSLITGFVCHAALSISIVLLVAQRGSSRSSSRTRCRRNRVITSASVLAYVSAVHILPFESSAASNESLGCTCLSDTVPAPSAGIHILRTYRHQFSQDSSQFIIRRPDSSSGIILNAYCCRRTRHLSELLCMGVVLAIRYPMCRSFLITLLTIGLLTSRPVSSITAA